MGLLNTIKSVFSKKDEDKIAPAVQPPKSGLLNTIINISKAVQPTLVGPKFVAPVIRDLLVKPAVRLATETGMTLGQPIFPNRIPKEMPAPTGKIGEQLFGTEPLRTVPQRIEYRSKELKLPKFTVAPLVLGGMVLDLPVLPGKKIAVETVDDLAKILTKELKLGADEGGEILLKDLIKRFKISPKVLEKVEQGIEKKSYSLYKEGEKIVVGLNKAPKTGKIVKEVTEKMVEKAPEKVSGLLESGEDVLRLPSGSLSKELKPSKRIVQLGETAEQTAKMIPVKFSPDQAPEKLVKAFSEIEDIPGTLTKTLTMNVTSPKRVIEFVARKSKEAANTLRSYIVDPVQLAFKSIVKESNRYVDELSDVIVNKLKIKPGSEADKWLMKFGEADWVRRGEELLPQMRKELGDEMAGNVVEANKYMRSQFDTLLERVNATLTKYGYEPIERLENYYHRYWDNVNKQLLPVGIPDELPTWLSGQTHLFKPGRKFWTARLERQGAMGYVDSAIGSFEDYLNGALYQIHMTEPIQRLRSTEKTMRKVTEMNPNLEYPSFASWVSNFTNLIAGKTSQTEVGAGMGRPGLGLMQSIINRVSTNAVIGNLSAAATNLIPGISQVPAMVSKDSYLKALWETIDRMMGRKVTEPINGEVSQFLLTRFPKEKLYRPVVSKVKNTIAVGNKITDQFSSLMAVLSKYNDGIKEGLSSSEAIKLADEFAERTLAGRTPGSTPVAFMEKGLGRLFLQFQLEPINQLEQLAWDIPKKLGATPKGSIVSTMSQLMIYSWLFNNAFEKVTGRRPTFDPIGMAVDMYQETQKGGDSLSKLKGMVNVVGQGLPVLQILHEGRVPLFAGFPSAKEWESDPLLASLKVAGTYLNPFGGGYQAYKTAGGVSAYSRGYEQNTKGEVMYPVAHTPTNLVKSVAFGKYSLPESKRYYDLGLKPMARNTSVAFKNTEPEKQEKLYAASMIARKAKEPQTILSEELNKLVLLIGDPKVSEKEKTKAKERLKKKMAEMKAKFPEELARFMKQFGFTPPASLTLPKQTIKSGGGISSLLKKKSNKVSLKLPKAKISFQQAQIKNKPVRLQAVRYPKPVALKKIAGVDKRKPKIVAKKNVISGLNVA